MNRVLVAIAAVALLGGGNALADSVPIKVGDLVLGPPTLGMTVDGTYVAIPAFNTTIGGKPVFGIGTSEDQPYYTYGGESYGWWSRVSGYVDPDPVISLTVSVTDFGAPSSFSFGTSQAIAVTGPSTVTASISGGLSNSGTDTSVSVTPFGQPKLLAASVGNPVTSLGVDVGDAQTNTGGATTFAYGPFNAADPSFPGDWTLLGLDLKFTGSGDGDGYAFTGIATINSIEPVPLPAALPLFAAGLGLLGFFARRQNAG
jgi:hypothetical protein